MNTCLNAILLIFILSGCASGPKCSNSTNSSTVFLNRHSCEVRIRSVQVASKMDLPKSIKDGDVTNWKLDWIESRLFEGRIETGHFSLEPQNSGSP